MRKPGLVLVACAALTALTVGCGATEETPLGNGTSTAAGTEPGSGINRGSLAEKPLSTPSGSLQPIQTSSARLDEASVRWFEAFCFGLTPLVAPNASAPTAAAEGDLTAVRDARVAQLRELGIAFVDTAADLEALPPPTIPDAERFVSNVVAGLQDGGAALTAGAEEYATVDASDAAAVAAAEQDVAADFRAAAASLGVASELPPAVQSSLQNIPPCKALSN